jgi:UDP-N-acetylglucosamine transferase subunit ALG13
MQIGSSTYEPKHAEWFRFESEEVIEKLYDDCSVIVCHGGAGTILNGLSRGRPLVIVPRREKFGEVTNDHQLLITEKVVAMGKGISVDDVDTIPEALMAARDISAMPVSADVSLVSYLSKRFESISKEISGRR